MGVRGTVRIPVDGRSAADELIAEQRQGQRDDCPLAAGLPEEVRKMSKELTAR